LYHKCHSRCNHEFGKEYWHAFDSRHRAHGSAGSDAAVHVFVLDSNDDSKGSERNGRLTNKCLEMAPKRNSFFFTNPRASFFCLFLFFLMF
jgi:hypothetical protein